MKLAKDQIFGRIVRPRDLIHADKHGFQVIEAESQPRILEGARFMDANECQTLIPAARSSACLKLKRTPASFFSAVAQF